MKKINKNLQNSLIIHLLNFLINLLKKSKQKQKINQSIKHIHSCFIKFLYFLPQIFKIFIFMLINITRSIHLNLFFNSRLHIFLINSYLYFIKKKK